MKFFIASALSLGLVGPALAQTPKTTITVSPASSRPTQPAPATHFTGSVRLQPLFAATPPSRVSGGSVSFEPGARSDWHSHPLGQTLIVTAGTGLVQNWDGPIQVMHKGDVVWTPPGVKHWHGATATTGMTHSAIQEETAGRAVEWMEKVSAAQYDQQPKVITTMTNDTPKEPSGAQKLFGDYSPKLADITDQVLFGDVWERPGLAKRDRSLITVASLVTGGNTEQLKSHLALAKTNGVTEEEIVEVLTHLAFYAGWPKAISAITVAKEVFKK